MYTLQKQQQGSGSGCAQCKQENKIQLSESEQVPLEQALVVFVAEDEATNGFPSKETVPSVPGQKLEFV